MSAMPSAPATDADSRTVWTDKLRLFGRHLEEEHQKVNHLLGMLYETAQTSEGEAAMAGGLLSDAGLLVSSPRSWECERGAKYHPAYYPGNDITLYADASWTCEQIREIANQAVQRHIEASTSDRFQYDWYVLSATDLPTATDVTWFVTYARSPSHAYVKPHVGTDKKRRGARDGLEYVGTWDEFSARVAAGERWDNATYPLISIDEVGGVDPPEQLASTLATASGVPATAVEAEEGWS